MIKATSLVLAAFAAGLAAPAASAGTPVVTAVTAVQPSPAALDALNGMFQDAQVSIEPARTFLRYFKRTFKRIVKGAAA